MLDILGAAAVSFGLALTGAAAPGPVLAMTISATRRHGAVTGPLVVAGHAVVEVILVLALFFGAGSFFQRDLVAGIVGVVGCVVLVWMGLSTMRGSRVVLGLGASCDVCQESRARNPVGDVVGHPATAGALTSLSNPYWWLWWVSVGTSNLAWARDVSPLGPFAFFVGHILGDLVWYSGVSASVAVAGKFVSGRVFRIVMISCGLALVGFGIFFGQWGARKLI